MTDSSFAALLFLQIACILITCGAVSLIAARVQQPRVIAEMVAGFLLGPSVLGWLAPAWHAALFPPSTLRTIYLLSQVGLALYMFCVGLEFRFDLMSTLRRRAISVSLAGIAAPFVLGSALAWAMHRAGGFFPVTVSPVQGALFMGAAMSITAFPVLARIIRERGITDTTVGALALSAGAIDDAAAWLILAVVLGSVSGRMVGPLLTALGMLAYGLVVVLVLRPLTRRLAERTERRDHLTPTVFLVVLALLMLSAWWTESIGVHAVFGAFVFGVSVPRGALTRELRRFIEPVTGALLIPLFFAYAGLQTRLSLVNSLFLWSMTALVFLTACGGKGIFCWLAARVTGASTRDALAIGTLMNARGMVELILLNIGLARGLITPTLYTMLVLMAIGTTVMTGPIFSLVWHRWRDDEVPNDTTLAASRLG